jgi:phospholipid/cholesterol/gamma-HCH transport system substrate-binding protein
MTRAQNIRVGLFAAATLVLFGVVLVVFGGLRFWEDVDHYHVVFDTSVAGLEPGAQVYLNGIKVGTVDDLAVVPEDNRKVSVQIGVEHGTPVRTDTHATLQLAGITGLKTIDLRGGTSQAAALPPGARIPAAVSLLDKLEAQAQTIADESSALIRRANRLTDNLIAVSDGLDAITDPARVAATNLAAMSSSLKGMVEDNRAALHQSLVAVRQTATGASHLIDDQVAPLVAGAGDVVAELKRLLATNEAPLRAAVFDLRQASRSFKELARDVRQKPSRLLFSNTPGERVLP